MADIKEIEIPHIYRPEDEGLPSFISLDPEGMLRFDPGFVREGEIGPYHFIADFQHQQEGLRQLVPQEERIVANGVRRDLFVLRFAYPEVEAVMGRITELANDPERSYENTKDRGIYRDQLEIVYRCLAEEAGRIIGGDNVLIFSPDNGGKFVREVWQKHGYSPERFFPYRLSRILGNEGELLVGAVLGENYQDVSMFNTYVLADDCLAANISAVTTMIYVRNERLAKGLPLNNVKWVVAVSAATQRGVEPLLSPEYKKIMGIGQIEVVTGILAPQMSENYYLQYPDGRFVVGDMGKWTASISS